MATTTANSTIPTAQPSTSATAQDPKRDDDPSTSTVTSGPAPPWQMDLLMQKLRQKATQLKPLAETAKNIRAALLERRCILDPSNKSHLQKSLDQLQQSITVNSLTSMVERLEMISRQQGLKFTPGATGNEWFISSDMFYLELLIDASGLVQEVKIQHDGKAEQQTCPEIIQSLRLHDFSDFTLHLEGLVGIYQLNADKKIKSKAFIALQALESDLTSMAGTYAHITDGEVIVMKSLLGFLQPRKGGHPVKLTFYITPYEFLDVSAKAMLPVDIATIAEKKIGTTGTISIQPFSSHKLQMNTTVTVVRQDGKSTPRYGQLNATNSTALPACFSLNFKPIPICKELLEGIYKCTGIRAMETEEPKPLLSLIVQHNSGGTLDCKDSQGLFVTLPDQIHCYFMTQTENLEGILVSNISFTLASQLPPVLNILRQQLTFNTLVASCVRVGNEPDLSSIVFEVNALSHQNLSVSFQHPLEESLVTLEFDLKDVTHPACHVHAVTNVADVIPTLEEHACKVVQRSMSIPITVRAVIKRWLSLKPKYDPPEHIIPVAGSSTASFLPTPDMTCGAESERTQQPSQPQQQQQVPNMVMNLSPKKSKPPPYTISPVTTSSAYSQPSVDLLTSYMNPLFSHFQNLSGLSLQNLQNFQNFPSASQAKMALQMNLLAIQQQGQQGNQKLLMGLMDQAGQRGRRRKRKGVSSDTAGPETPPASTPPRPSPSPSPTFRRRPSESSDISDSNETIGLLMSELGLENPDPRWNIELTPVPTTSAETFIANKVSDSEMDPDAMSKFSLPKKSPIQMPRRPRDFPKRSISLDSSQDNTTLSLIQDGNFKPLLTPSLSITPVSTNSSMASSSVNSLLANIRPGIEIIPLPNPVQIPTSITVTPITPKIEKSPIKDPKKTIEKKERKRKIIAEEGKQLKLMSGYGPIGNPTGVKPIRPNFTLVKKQSSPAGMGIGMGTATTTTSTPKIGGKPSVSTLKSVQGSPKSIEVKKSKPRIGPLQKSQKNPLSKEHLTTGMNLLISQFQAGIKQEQQQPTAVLAKGILDMTKGKPVTPITKKVNLAAIVDKLKSQCTSEEPNKKELSKLDYIKASTSITSELQKKTPGQEYIVKPGGQGSLKLTINKTKALGKDKMKTGVGGTKPPVQGVKRPFMQGKPAIPVKKKKVEKDGSPGAAKQSPKPTEDLTKKLFMPGAVRSLESGMFDGPKFDSTFQIPKKSRTTVSEAKTLTPEAKTPVLEEEQPIDTPKLDIEPQQPEEIAVPMNLSQSAADEPPPPILQAQVPAIPSPDVVSPPVLPVATATVSVPKTPTPPPETFVSPESPDPISAVEEAKPPMTIPTTPQPHLAPAPVTLAPPPVEVLPLPSPDPDQLIMDIPGETAKSSDSSVRTPTSTTAVESPTSMPPPPPPPEVSVPSPIAHVPIVSVHIVHSPQPNSPALLRSPMMALASPHSLASPYTVDDDLMDEAVIGAGN